MKSPITSSEHTRLLENISVERLIAAWDERMDIDVTSEFEGVENIEKYKCLDTGLQFFRPTGAAGGDAFYQALEKFDWYYMPEKWEHTIAEEDIEAGDRVLEVGCGKGDFVHRLNQKPEINAIGIELNSSAVREAQAKDWNVVLQDLSKIAEAEPASFDVVCHFQVLEHISHPTPFLEQCIDCLKPGGRLLIGVPNMAGFISDAKNDLMNMPPHHMGQWFPSTFRRLPDYLPVELERIEYEPLAEYHTHWYTSTRVAQIDGSTLLGKIRRSLRFRLLYQATKVEAIRRRIHGHSQYVSFRKVSPS